MTIYTSPFTETVDARFENSIFSPEATVTVENGDGILARNSEIAIFGAVISEDGTGIDASLSNEILIAEGANVAGFGADGIGAEDIDLANYGLMRGDDQGLDLAGSGSEIANGGVIEGGMQGILARADAEIANLDGGRIVGESEEAILAQETIAVQNDGYIIGAEGGIRAPGGSVDNAGVVRGSGTSVEFFGFSDDTVSNEGKLLGAVLLGDGDDQYLGRGGFLAGRADGGDGDDLLLAGSSGDVLVGGNGQDLMEGGPASDRLNGNRGPDQLFGGGGIDALNGGFGRDIIFGGPGDDEIRGGPGSDIFIITRNDGFDRIAFQRIDELDISDFGFRDFERDVEPRLERDGSATLLDLGDGDGARLDGVRPAQLDADNFIL